MIAAGRAFSARQTGATREDGNAWKPGNEPMQLIRLHAVAACVVAIAVAGCGKEQPAAGAPGKSSTATAEQKASPYAYPAPVKGHYKEVNIGEFDVVDGIAYPASRGLGTVVYVTDKPIASPMIAGSACPMTQARALSQLRDAKYLEVTLVKGVSQYYAAGKSFGGSSREQEAGGRYWSSRMKNDPDRAVGSVVHKSYGTFEFDLPMSKPAIKEVSEGDRSQDIRADATAATPTQHAVYAAYHAMLAAAQKKNLTALLTAQGFDAKQVAAIRGLDGIDADFAVYADRFLTPGLAGEFTARPGTAYVRADGMNSKAKKFANFYHFAPCGDHLVLVGIAENPQ